MKIEKKQKTLKKKHLDKLRMQSDKKVKQTFDGHTFKQNESKRKFSEIFISFIDPLLEMKMDNDAEVKEILNWGQFVWNKSVADNFPEHSKSKDINLLFPLFYATSNDKDLINDFILRKKALFNNDNFLIIHFETQFDDDRNMAISVVALEMEE